MNDTLLLTVVELARLINTFAMCYLAVCLYARGQRGNSQASGIDVAKQITYKYEINHGYQSEAASAITRRFFAAVNGNTKPQEILENAASEHITHNDGHEVYVTDGSDDERIRIECKHCEFFVEAKVENRRYSAYA